MHELVLAKEVLQFRVSVKFILINVDEMTTIECQSLMGIMWLRVGNSSPYC
jgi:hypothetical protein